MSDAFESWETDDKGHLKVWPLLAFSTALFANESGGLRLEIGKAAPKPGEPVPALQLVLSVEQLRALGEALVEAADALAGGPATATGPGRGHMHG